MKVTIGIPAFNEEKNIAKIITSLKKITDSIIICDDGSSDMTSEISSELGATVVKHKKNFGYGAAIKTIFQKAKEIQSKIGEKIKTCTKLSMGMTSDYVDAIKEGATHIRIGTALFGDRKK